MLERAVRSPSRAHPEAELTLKGSFAPPNQQCLQDFWDSKLPCGLNCSWSQLQGGPEMWQGARP